MLGAATIVLPLAIFFAWLTWRDRSVRGLCGEVRVGMSIEDLLRLEQKHSIDSSYWVQAIFDPGLDQARIHELEFRGFMMDPNFTCLIDHDGRHVTKVQALEL